MQKKENAVKKPARVYTFMIGEKQFSFDMGHWNRFSKDILNAIENGQNANDINFMLATYESSKAPRRRGGFTEPRKKAFMSLMEGKQFTIGNDLYEVKGSTLMKNGKPSFKVMLWFKKTTK